VPEPNVYVFLLLVLISVQKDVEAENAKFNDAVQKYEAEKSMSKVHKANTHTHSLSLSLYRSRSLILHQVDKLLKEYNAKVEETKKYVAEIPPATPFDMRIKRSPLSLSLSLSFSPYSEFMPVSVR
jgi:endonuclease III